MSLTHRQTMAAEALDRIERVTTQPRAFVVGREAREAIGDAIERARSQLLGSPEPVLMVAIVGATGAGKSALINRLAGARIAEVGVKRPTTARIRVYHHSSVEIGGLPAELAQDAVFVPHDREELRTKVLIDTPDLDTFVTEHRERTQRLVKAAGLVLFTFSPERYLEERVWSIIRTQIEFSACAAVLNKIDLLDDEEEKQIEGDLRERFEGVGVENLRLFPVAADPEGGEESSEHGRPGVAGLRDFLERELRESDTSRLVASQRRRIVEHLARLIAHAVDASALEKIADIGAKAGARVGRRLGSMKAQLGPSMAQAEADLRAQASVRQHARFFGPMRAWLAVGDFLRHGIPAAVSRLLAPSAERDLERSLRPMARMMNEALRDETAAIGDALYTADLPAKRWNQIAAEPVSPGLMERASADIENAFSAWLGTVSVRRVFAVWLGSLVGWLVPVGLTGFGLYLMVLDLLEQRYEGLTLLGHLVAISVGVFVALHVLVAVILPQPPRIVGRMGVGSAIDAVRGVISSRMELYREGVAADLDELDTQVRVLRESLEGRQAHEPPMPEEEVAK